MKDRSAQINISSDSDFCKFRNRLTDYMGKLNISDAKLAEMTGVSKDIVYNIRKDRSDPGIAFMSKLPDVTGHPVDYFFDNEYKIKIDYDEKRMLDDIDDNDKFRILILCELFKYNSVAEFNNDKINSVLKPDRDIKKIGYLIRLQRIMHNMSVDEFGTVFGYQGASVANLESDNSVISNSSLCRLCMELEIPFDFFLMGRLKDNNYIIDYLLNDLLSNLDEKGRDIMKKILYYNIEWIKHLSCQRQLNKLY